MGAQLFAERRQEAVEKVGLHEELMKGAAAPHRGRSLSVSRAASRCSNSGSRASPGRWRWRVLGFDRKPVRAACLCTRIMGRDLSRQLTCGFAMAG